MANNDDDSDFTLSDDVISYNEQQQKKAADTMADTDIFVTTPFKNMQTAETGAVSTFTDADPARKIVANFQKRYYIQDPVTNEPLTSPNEDAHAVDKITLAADANPEEQLAKVMTYVEQGHRARVDGATVTSALISEGKLYTANLGDSPALVAVIDPEATPKNGKKMVELKQITTDHIADNEAERAMLPAPECASNHLGASSKWRVYQDKSCEGAGLMLTRVAGDSEYRLNRTVETKVTDLNPDIEAGKQVMVIVGSDGIMEKTGVERIEKALNIMAANNFRSGGKAKLSPEEIAASLTSERFSESKDGIVTYQRNDDTTIVVQPITEELAKKQPDGKKTAAMITVADGHNYQYERTPDDDVVFDENKKAVPKYEKQLSQTVTEEMQRYMKSPHLMRESRLQRGE